MATEVCEVCQCDPCVCFDEPEIEPEEDEEIAETRTARQQVERAIFVNGGLRNFLTERRGA